MNRINVLILLFLFSFSFSCLNGQVKQVLPEIYSSAQNVLNELFGSNITNLCQYYKCELVNNTNSFNPLYTITGLDLSNYEILGTGVNNEITNLKNLTFINIPSCAIFNSNFLMSIYKLTKLETLIACKILSNVTFTLPSSLKTIIVGSFEYDGLSDSYFNFNVETIEVNNILPSFPTLNNINFKLKHLKLPVPANNGEIMISDDMVSKLQGLESIFLIQNTSYNQLSVPTMSLFKSLNNITFQLQNQSIQHYYLPTNLCDASTLKYVEFRGKGMNNNPNGVDFRNCQNYFTLYFNNNGDTFKNNCINAPCYKFPSNTTVKILNSNIKLSNFDLSNIINLNVNLNNETNILPSNLSSTNFQSFKITNSEVTGNVSSIYCKFLYNSIDLSGNKFETVNDCFKCGYIDWFTGNTPNLEKNCSVFNLDFSITEKVLFPTNGAIIKLYGSNLGWEYYLDGDHIFFDEPNPDYLKVVIPPGIGKNYHFDYVFQNGSIIKQLLYSYYPPKINSYSIDQEDETFILYGSNFDYINENQVTINGNLFFFKKQENSNNFIVAKDYSSFIKNLIEGQKYNLTISGENQFSSFEFIFILNQFSISDKNIILFTNGGQVTINGTFSINETLEVQVLIDYHKCSIVSMTNSTITIYYPSNTVGTKLLDLNIGGRIFSVEVSYVEPIQDRSEDISSSSNLIIQFYMFSLLFILIFIH